MFVSCMSNLKCPYCGKITPDNWPEDQHLYCGCGYDFEVPIKQDGVRGCLITVLGTLIVILFILVVLVLIYKLGNLSSSILF